MIQKLPRDCRWILVGDYNLIKSSNYKLSECGWLIFQIKVACKELAQNLLECYDKFNPRGRLEYIWEIGAGMGLKFWVD